MNPVTVKTGPQKHLIAADYMVKILSQKDFHVLLSDTEDGEKTHLCIPNSDNQVDFKANKPTWVHIIIGSRDVWGWDIIPINSKEEVDPVPFEVPDQAPLTMEQRMEIFLENMVRERYGKDSEEYESLEDASDFDIPETDPLSGYEITEMLEEEFRGNIPEGDESEAETAVSDVETSTDDSEQSEPEPEVKP